MNGDQARDVSKWLMLDYRFVRGPSELSPGHPADEHGTPVSRVCTCPNRASLDVLPASWHLGGGISSNFLWEGCRLIPTSPMTSAICPRSPAGRGRAHAHCTHSSVDNTRH